MGPSDSSELCLFFYWQLLSSFSLCFFISFSSPSCRLALSRPWHDWPSSNNISQDCETIQDFLLKDRWEQTSHIGTFIFPWTWLGYDMASFLFSCFYFRNNTRRLGILTQTTPSSLQLFQSGFFFFFFFLFFFF